MRLSIFNSKTNKQSKQPVSDRTNRGDDEAAALPNGQQSVVLAKPLGVGGVSETDSKVDDLSTLT